MTATTVMETVGTKSVSLARAKQLLARGSDLLDPRDLHNCPIKIPNGDIPSPQVTEEKVVAARDRGESLALFLPVAAKTLYDATGNQIGQKGKLFYSDWPVKPDQAFGTTETQVTKPTWAFVKQEPIPGSTGHNFLQQTCDRASYLTEQVYAGQSLPRVYQEAIIELNDRKAKLERLMADDWQEADTQLSGLALNQLCCPTYVGLIYFWWLHLAINGEYLYRQVCGWTRSLSRYRCLVAAGSCGSSGAYASGGWRPRFSSDGLGAPFLRLIGGELMDGE